MRGEPCPLAAEADAVVFALPPDDPRSDAILAAHQRLHPDVPLCVDLPDDALESLSVPAGVKRLPRRDPDTTVAEVVRRVLFPKGQRSLGSGPREGDAEDVAIEEAQR